MESICVNGSANLAGIAATVVTVASMAANFIPAPDKINNTVLRGTSRAIHVVAFDITTGAQPKK